MLRNSPETIIEGRIGTNGRIEYFFSTFGAVAILCIEVKLKIGNDAERLEAIAQVIAECDGKSDELWIQLSTTNFLNLQVATSITPKMVMISPSTAFFAMGCLLSFSSSKESRSRLFFVAVFRVTHPISDEA